MPNRLADSTSPYLLQHEDNPVDWWEWSDEAFEEARRRDVPVLLSVGYAACHWCHVMAHESFEDDETAALMNRLYVNVKVDREERPDVDSIYMEAVQAMTGRGGWPMTVWMDHRGRPFYAGTYFPREPRHGMPGFKEVLTALASAWQMKRDDIDEQAARLLQALTTETLASSLPNERGIEAAYEQVVSSFDPVNGGFGSAPKFPQQPVLEFLLRVRKEPWASRADQILGLTLDKMARGGIHDQVGGGFARYSVDERWLVPHFEKMLYDNAQLARLYLWAGVELSRPDFIDVARFTLDYLIRDLKHERGGFFSSEDADSEGVEGKFYAWSKEELIELLGAGADRTIDYLGVTETGNFEGSNILTAGVEEPEDLEESKRILHKARDERIRPGLDDKVITSWNGLAIRALAEAGVALGESRYLEAASDAARFVLDELIVDGRLMRSWREGRTSVPGFLDDHAAMAIGLYALFAATGDVEWYDSAATMVDEFERFANPDGGFYTTAEDAESLVKRPVDQTDNPLPSGNALAAEALLLAGLYTGESESHERAESTLAAAGTLMSRYPSAVGHHLAIAYSATRTQELAIVGSDWPSLAEAYWDRFRPQVALAVSSGDDHGIPLLADRHRPEATLGYVCRDFVCERPVARPDELRALLDL